MWDQKLTVPFFYLLIDKNKDNNISKDEFIERMQKIPKITLNKLEAEQFFNILDQDKNGGVSYKEMVITFWDIYLRDMLEKLHNIEKGNLDKLFNSFVMDWRGFLSPQDFQQMISIFNAEFKDYEVDMLFKYFDPEGTKQITMMQFEKGFWQLNIK